jgi:hypothetical protein
MIAALPIAAGLLAVLSDDEAPDFQEMFQRAIMFKNPNVLYSAMTDDQISEFVQSLFQWACEVRDEESKDVFNLFFNGFPAFTVLHSTGNEVIRVPIFDDQASASANPAFHPGEDYAIVDEFLIHVSSKDPRNRHFAIGAFTPSDQYYESDQEARASASQRLVRGRFSRMNSRIYPYDAWSDSMSEAVFDSLRYGISLIKVADPSISDPHSGEHEGGLWAILNTLDGKDVRPAWAKR